MRRLLRYLQCEKHRYFTASRDYEFFNDKVYIDLTNTFSHSNMYFLVDRYFNVSMSSMFMQNGDDVLTVRRDYEPEYSVIIGAIEYVHADTRHTRVVVGPFIYVDSDFTLHRTLDYTIFLCHYCARFSRHHRKQYKNENLIGHRRNHLRKCKKKHSKAVTVEQLYVIGLLKTDVNLMADLFKFCFSEM